jgi:serine/threonine-protein kinase
VNLLCPACHTPLPAASTDVVSCPACAAEVDVTRAGTVAGRPRFVPEIDRVGTTVGGLRVEARIGRGGMGTVYRAVDDGGRAVALKLLAPALAQSPETAARFAREIAALARLEHPAIVRVLAHGTDGGAPWFAMELVDGQDLRARFAAGPLAPREAAAIFGRLFAALDHAHQRGVVHRDLKPANVLLAADGARLADFGIARIDAEALTGADALTRLTETAAVIGTLPYMSPEQRRGGAVDRRADLFSAGVMLYEAATGALPQGAFPMASEVNPDYGRAFDRLLLRLLQPDPARRPASADEVARALAAALAPPRRRTLAISASAATLLAAALATAAGGRALSSRRHVAGAAPTAAHAAPLPPPPINAALATPPPTFPPAAAAATAPEDDVDRAAKRDRLPAADRRRLAKLAKTAARALSGHGAEARLKKVGRPAPAGAVTRPTAPPPVKTRPITAGAKVAEIGGRWTEPSGEPGAPRTAPAPAVAQTRRSAPDKRSFKAPPPDDAGFAEVEGVVKDAVPPARNRFPDAGADPDPPASPRRPAGPIKKK